MTEATKPHSGLGSKAKQPSAQSLLQHQMLSQLCERPQAYIDFVRIIFKLPTARNITHVTAASRRPAEWGAASIEITLAGEEIPHALNPCNGSSNYFALTVHEPHKRPFAVDLLPKFLAQFDAKICPEYSVAEFGIELHPKATERAFIQSDAQGKKLFREISGHFLARLFSHLKHMHKFCKNSARVFYPYLPGEQEKTRSINTIPCANGWLQVIPRGVQGTDHGGAAIAASMSLTDRNATFYAGNKSQKQTTGKKGATKQSWLANTQLRAYHKDSDRASALPVDAHHFRIEITTSCCPSAGEDFNIDPLELLQGSSKAASTMARFFNAQCWDNALLGAMRQRDGFGNTHAKHDFILLIAGKEFSIETLRRKFKREGMGDTKLPKLRPDTEWNQAMTNGFISLCAKMRRSGERAAFTFMSTTPSLTPGAPAAEQKTAEVSTLQAVNTEKKPSTSQETAITTLTPATQEATSMHAQPLITTPTPPPSEGWGFGTTSLKVITDEELDQFIDQVEQEQQLSP